MKKILLLILGMLLFINVKAAMITDYSSAIRGANNYMEKLRHYNLYLINDNNVKYGYNSNSLIINASYTKGGLLNIDEFNISNSNGNTYLFNGTKYWTMTEDGSSAGVVSSFLTEQAPKTDNYGSRVTEYVRTRIWVMGSGSYGDPWVFDEDSAVNYVAKFYPTNGTVGTNSKVITYKKSYGELPVPTYTGYDFEGWYSNIAKALIWKENLGVNSSGATTSKSGYATTKDVIAIDGSVLYSNVAISGVWAFDSNKSLIRKVSSNATVHSLPSNTKYIRIEINTESTPLNSLIITKGVGMLSSANINEKADSDTKLDVLEDIGLYAKWKASVLTLAPGNTTAQYSASSAQTKNNFVTEPTGGTGSYSYVIVSGNDSDYFTLSGRNLTIKAATPVGIYPITVRVTDNNSEATAEGVMTLQIDRIAAECPTATAYTGVYDGNPHTITINGSTANLQYSTNGGTSWTATKPTRTNVGTTTVSLKLTQTANYNETDCGSKTIKITKATPTCPTVIAYSGDYNGSAHTISVSGGVGGAINYSTDNANWSTTLPSRTAAGTTTVYIKMASNTNYNEKSCGSSTITVNQVAATCPTATSFSGNYDGNSHTITVSGGTGGTVKYSTDGSTWTTTKPTRTNAGTTTVHIKVEADENHTTITCEDRLITINKIDATCPTVTAFSGNYDGNSHTITVSGGANGTVKYSTDNSTWTTTKPTRTNAGTTTVYIKIEADANGNYKTKTCSNSSIAIAKVNATCPTVTAYSGNYDGNSHTITVSGGSGGTIKYSTDGGSTWSTTKPTRTAAGTTTIKIKVEADANGNYNTKTCSDSSIAVAAVDATCPTTSDYSGNYDGSSHSITVSGGSGGTIQYRTATSGDGSTWTATKPTRTDAGTTTVYVRVSGDSNHNTVTCTSRSIKINKIDATCPTITSYSGNYDGSSHSITVTGGANGTIKYSTDGGSTWSTTKPTRTAAGTTTVNVKIEAASNGNYNTKTCGSATIQIIQSTATVTFSCNGSSGTAPSNVTANIGTYTVPTSKPCGYKVTAGSSGKVQYQSGWATSSTGSAVTSANLTSSGLVLYAVWSDLFTYNASYYIYNDGSGHYRIEFRSSGTLTMKAANTVDIHAVGGGGGGGSDSLCNYYAGGGGGGYTTTAKNKSLSATTYTITVGGGGEGGNASHTTGNTGTASSFGSLCTANGGTGGAASIRWAGGTGGNGGSGGGSGNAGDVRPCSTQGKGGSNGSNGTAGTLNTGYSGANVGAAGTGQGTTTRDFGDSGGTLRSGGGSGGNRYCAVAGGDDGGGTGGTGKGAGGAGTANYGGGGGGASQNGGSGCSRTLGGAGGSGIVIMRDKR